MTTLHRATSRLLCTAGLLASALLAACGGGSDQGRDPILGLPSAALANVSITPTTATLLVGARQQLTATATYADGSSQDVTTASTWASAAPAVATVSATGGFATAVTAGGATVTATFGAKAGSAVLTVTAPPVVIPPVVVPPVVVPPVVPPVVVPPVVPPVVVPPVVVPPVVVPPVVVPPVVVPPVVVPPVVVPPVVVPPVVVPPVVVPPVVVPPVVVPPGASVNLGTAGNFAVLAGTSITNNSGGTTLITGNVGAPSQTTDPVVAPGYVNLKSGAVLATAMADLQVAITDANSRTCTVNSAAGVDLGGLVLPPGVYCYAGAISITGTFTMNGPGVYIFRTASTLNSTANSVVALTGGATAADVSWVPVGPTTLGANSVFKGSILGQSAAITLGDNVTVLNGRVLTAAAVTLRNNQIAK